MKDGFGAIVASAFGLVGDAMETTSVETEVMSEIAVS